MLQALQRSAGNAAASAYVQRLAESPGPARTAAVPPQNDPRFQAVAAKVAGQGRRLRQHPPPRAEARQAADAADPPATDKEAKAKASRADTMSTAKPGGFDKAGFIAAVKKAIAAQAPKNLDEAENFEKSGKAESVKTEVSGRVTEGKRASAQDIAEKTAAAPDTSKMAEKPVTPLRPAPQPAAPRVNTAAAMPAPVPAARTDLSGDQRETDTAMTQAGVTEQQLATSNEPEFTDALAAKKEGEEHSATAPAAFRETEAAQLGAAKQEAQGAGAAGLAGMLATKKGSLSGASAGKTAAKTQEEAERARIATQIKAIFDATKTDVDALLGGLDAKVDLEFSTGEAAVRKAFTADLDARMDEYKRKRYSGPGGSARWTWDLFADLPEEANRCYTEARKLYEQDMGVLIGRVADLIGKDLTAAKDRIAKGRADIKAYVDAQPKNLQKIAQQAAGQFASQFDQLENDVDAKKDALVDDLATKYSESKAAVEEEITAMQEENKGLWSKAKSAVGGAIQTINQLKDLLTSALARAAGAIGKIIKDPIGFLGKFVNAVKGGIVRFGENIAQHLKAGLQGWLLGSLSAAGIDLPAKFDLKGIIGLVLSLLGLTWPAIRARIAKRVPEKVMSGVEKSVAFIQVVLSEGVGGLWKWVVEKLGDIKEMVMGQIREFVITKIVKAGITWLISMLNPAAAFIKACKMIYDVVMFFVERAAQIKEFVDSVLDSVESIAGGGVGAVAGHIEKTLAKMVPVLLGFLASLLGLGGISEKIKEIIAKVQKPVGQVVDKLVAGAVRIGKSLLKSLSGKAGRLAAKGAAIYRHWKTQVRFNASGSGHRISLRESKKGSFKIEVSSKPKSIKQTVGTTKKAASLALVDVNDVSRDCATILKKEERIIEMARQARMRAGAMPPPLTAALEDLGSVVAACWSRIGFDGENVDRVKKRRGDAGEVGEIGRHSQGGNTQGKRAQTSKGTVPARILKLESEHIVPWSWIDIIFSKLYQVGRLPSQGKSKVYPRMTTVMTYARAAKGKTSKALKNSDMEILRFLKGIPPKDAEEILRAQLPQLIEHRVQTIINETAKFVEATNKKYKSNLLPKPDRETINRALSAQLAEMFSAARELK